MEILKYRKDANSPWQDIAAIVGPMGPQGEPGKDGANGIDGKDGYTPVKGVDYFDGEQGPQGIQGEPGPAGKDGAPGEKGEDGAPGKDGADGKPFTYEDFTPEQLEALRGPQGEQGPAGEPGEAGQDGVGFKSVSSLPTPSAYYEGKLYECEGKYYKVGTGTVWRSVRVGDNLRGKVVWFDYTKADLSNITYTNPNYPHLINPRVGAANAYYNCLMITDEVECITSCVSMTSTSGYQQMKHHYPGATSLFNYPETINGVTIDYTIHELNSPFCSKIKIQDEGYVWVEVFLTTPQTFEIGTVVEGDEASVANVGTVSTAVLNFTIPKGDKGEAFTYEDFTEEQLEALRGPQGIPGEQGLQGEPGTPGTNGVDGKDGKDGADYILTEADKEEIAAIVLAQMPEGSILPESEEVSF